MADDGVASCAGFDVFGPGPHERYTGAAFVERAFAVAERRVVGGRLVAGPFAPVGELWGFGFAFLGGFFGVLFGVAVDIAAVVGVENDDRVFSEAIFVEAVEDTAKTFIDAFQHRG